MKKYSKDEKSINSLTKKIPLLKLDNLNHISRIIMIGIIINFIMTLVRKKEGVSDPNPWKATTLEWVAAPSPPIGHGNFSEVPSVYRGPYEYSVPDEDEDFIPQNKN